MNPTDLQTMLDYHYWARDRVFEAIERLTPEQYHRDLGSSFKSIRDTLTHIYAAEWAWFMRWQGESPTALLPADRFPDLPSLEAAWREHEGRMRAFVGGLDANGTARVIQYTLLSGQPGASPIWQMVQHVVNHASYHRGQLTTMLRQIGAEPPKSMDMIAYYRVKEAART
jgi:uncharacterized damage-inducible protein DinB